MWLTMWYCRHLVAGNFVTLEIVTLQIHFYTYCGEPSILTTQCHLAKPWYLPRDGSGMYWPILGASVNIKPLNISFDFIKVLFIALDLGKLGQPGFYHDFSNLLNWTKSTNFNDIVSSQIIREWHSMIIRSRCWGHVDSMLIILWPMGCKSSQ